jgi:DNA-binding HxlR family transcriptional regulator
VCDYFDDMRYPIDRSIQLLGKKWATPILLELLSGKDRFNVLLRAIPKVNSKTLSARLEDFQKAGLVEKQELATKPRQTRYGLTPKGEEFRMLTREMAGFSMKWHRG